MAQLKSSRAIVRGAGPFPIDMLRYDNCYPADESEAQRQRKELAMTHQHLTRNAFNIVSVSNRGTVEVQFAATGEPIHVGALTREQADFQIAYEINRANKYPDLCCRACNVGRAWGEAAGSTAHS